jgi:hypothetical protein
MLIVIVVFEADPSPLYQRVPTAEIRKRTQALGFQREFQ